MPAGQWTEPLKKAKKEASQQEASSYQGEFLPFKKNRALKLRKVGKIKNPVPNQVYAGEANIICSLIFFALSL